MIVMSWLHVRCRLMNERLDPALLVALDSLLRERSVTRAAKHLGVTQSAVSHTLKRLRESLGDPLLVGSRGDLTLTARAASIRAPLERALADLRASVRANVAFVPAASSRSFTIATVDYGEFWTMHKTLRIVRREAPKVSIRIASPRPGILEDLTCGSVDLLVGPKRAWPAHVQQQKVAQDGFVVIGRKGHPAFKPRLTLKSYLAHSHISVGPQDAPVGGIDEVLRSRGHTRSVILFTPNFVGAPTLVARSDLLATIPEGLYQTWSSMITLEHAATPFSIPATDLFMVWHERQQNDEGHAWLRSLARNVLTKTTRVRV